MNNHNTRRNRAFRLALAICILCLLASSGHVIAQTSARTKTAKIDEVMVAASKLRQFNGSVLVAENGKVIYKKGLGLANMEWNIPNATDTKFRLGSITKQFTATLVLQLVQEGKIKLDGKLADYLPAYRKDTGERITIHQLLNHTSGIPSYTGMANLDEVSRNPYRVDDFVKRFASHDLQFEPGSKFAYNNSGYFLLGAIIEKVTGQTYEQALKTKILDPLGMKNTGYDHYGPILAKRASGYVKLPEGYKNADFLDMSVPYAAGSMYSTVEDLYLWDQALYTDRVLSPEFKALMFKPNLSEYAYGWAITEAKLPTGDEKILKIAHDGGINGFSTAIVRMPAQKHLIVFLDNTSQGGSLRRLERAITNILYSQPYDVPKMSIAEVMLKTINDEGAEAGIAQYREYKERQPTRYDFSEGEINQLGYRLLRAGKVKDAIEVFKLNVQLFPQSSNTYDSLGEAFLNSGNTEFAIQNYKRSLALDPKNENAVTVLKRLESKPAAISPHLLDAYVGEYEVTPDFKVRVYKDGEKLMAQATGQQPFELSPDGENAFFVKAVNARVTFGMDDKGAATGLVIYQNGQEIPGRKIK